MIQEKRDEEEKTPDAFVQLGLFGYMSYESAGWCRGATLSAVGGVREGGGEKKKNLSSASQSVAVESHDCCSYKARKQPSWAKFWVSLPRHDLKNEEMNK